MTWGELVKRLLNEDISIYIPYWCCYEYSSQKCWGTQKVWKEMCQVSVYSTCIHSGLCEHSFVLVLLGVQNKSVKGGKDRAQYGGIHGYIKLTKENFTSCHFRATVFICCVCTGRQKARTSSCHMKCRCRFCLHFELLHWSGTLTGEQYETSIFLSDLRLLRTAPGYCIWNKQCIIFLLLDGSTCVSLQVLPCEPGKQQIQMCL